MTSESGRRERWAAMRAAMVALKAELRAEWAWYPRIPHPISWVEHRFARSFLQPIVTWP
jgi:hypothetical protein